jgi:hypothetical protein
MCASRAIVVHVSQHSGTAAAARTAAANAAAVIPAGAAGGFWWYLRCLTDPGAVVGLVHTVASRHSAGVAFCTICRVDGQAAG